MLHIIWQDGEYGPKGFAQNMLDRSALFKFQVSSFYSLYTSISVPAKSNKPSTMRISKNMFLLSSIMATAVAMADSKDHALVHDNMVQNDTMTPTDSNESHDHSLKCPKCHHHDDEEKDAANEESAETKDDENAALSPASHSITCGICCTMGRVILLHTLILPRNLQRIFVLFKQNSQVTPFTIEYRMLMLVTQYIILVLLLKSYNTFVYLKAESPPLDSIKLLAFYVEGSSLDILRIPHGKELNG